MDICQHKDEIKAMVNNFPAWRALFSMKCNLIIWSAAAKFNIRYLLVSFSSGWKVIAHTYKSQLVYSSAISNAQF